MEKISSKFKFAIHNKTFFKHMFFFLTYHFSKNIEKKHKGKLKCYFNYAANPSNPNSFNEYLLWINSNYKNDLWKKCADKLACKEFLESKGFGEYLPKTLGIYQNSKEIDLDKLPNSFMLKTNNDSGSVFVCEKGKTNFEKVFKYLDNSLKSDYASETNEWFYEGIKPKIFAEEILKPAEEIELVDYKFFTFNGKFRFGFTGQNRSKDIRFQLFEPGYKFVDCEYIHLRPKKKDSIKKPAKYEEMEKLAEQVGSLFDFVRVDLYNTKDGIRIGELTFCSMSGFGGFTKKEYDFKYGEYFKDTIFYDLAHKK